MTGFSAVYRSASRRRGEYFALLQPLCLECAEVAGPSAGLPLEPLPAEEEEDPAVTPIPQLPWQGQVGLSSEHGDQG